MPCFARNTMRGKGPEAYFKHDLLKRCSCLLHLSLDKHIGHLLLTPLCRALVKHKSSQQVCASSS